MDIISNLSPGTVQALAWGFLLISATSLGVLVRILWMLVKANIEHNMRLDNLEEFQEAAEEVLWPIQYHKRKKS
jgi:hypothetical protein